MSKEFTDTNFKEEVLDFKGVVLIDFWAEWCGPCRMQGPIIDKLSEKYSTNADVKIGKLNVDDSQQTAMKYNVMSIPTLLYIKNGQVVDILVGLRPEGDIEAKLLEHLKAQ